MSYEKRQLYKYSLHPKEGGAKLRKRKNPNFVPPATEILPNPDLDLPDLDFLDLKEKEIHNLADILDKCLEYDEWSALEYGETVVDSEATARNLYEKGVVVSDVGFWSDKDDEGYYWCSHCVSPVKDVSAFCPWCGKMMKVK